MPRQEVEEWKRCHSANGIDISILDFREFHLVKIDVVKQHTVSNRAASFFDGTAQHVRDRVSFAFPQGSLL